MTGRGARARGWAAALLGGALPVLAFPRANLDWLAWVALVPVLLVIRAAGDVRSAAVCGWWFGAGFLLAALHWTIPNIGPGLLLIAAVGGALWAIWGVAAWATLRDPVRPLAALALVPSAWVLTEYARSWHVLGGPWALLGVSQWRHPTVLSLAALGGVWLVSLALVAVNTAVAIAVLAPRLRVRVLALGVALAAGLAGPASWWLRSEPAERTLRVALVQPGVVHNPTVRFAAGERLTRGLPEVDLVVWGESSVGFDLSRRPDLLARLTALAARAELLAGEDAPNARGQISKASLLIGPDGIRGRYVKTRLVPFGEYVPLRPALGWLTEISEAADIDRVPGTDVRVLPVRAVPSVPPAAGSAAGSAEGPAVDMDGMGDSAGATIGPLICFESTFPDLGRAVVARGAQMVVYQSATSTFQESWAPPQHASLAAVRAVETGRPTVQAALTGVSVAFDARGRELAWLDTGQRGAVLATLPVPAVASRTPFDRYGDVVPYAAALLCGAYGVAGGIAAWPGRTARRQQRAGG